MIIATGLFLPRVHSSSVFDFEVSDEALGTPAGPHARVLRRRSAANPCANAVHPSAVDTTKAHWIACASKAVSNGISEILRTASFQRRRGHSGTRCQLCDRRGGTVGATCPTRASRTWCTRPRRTQPRCQPVPRQNSIIRLDAASSVSDLRNVPRASSGRCLARNSQDACRPRARKPGAATATRRAPPPLEAAATWSARSRLLGVSLQTVGAVARCPSHRSP